MCTQTQESKPEQVTKDMLATWVLTAGLPQITSYHLLGQSQRVPNGNAAGRPLKASEVAGVFVAFCWSQSQHGLKSELKPTLSQEMTSLAPSRKLCPALESVPCKLGHKGAFRNETAGSSFT